MARFKGVSVEGEPASLSLLLFTPTSEVSFIVRDEDGEAEVFIERDDLDAVITELTDMRDEIDERNARPVLALVNDFHNKEG